MGSVGRRKAEGLNISFEELGAQWPAWAWLQDRLPKAGLDPTSARELRTKDPRSSWVILAKPAEALVKQFELAPEVLVLCTPWDNIQANDIKRTEAVYREELRADPGFVLVITGDPKAETRLGPSVPDRRRYLFLRGETFEKAGDPQAFLRNLLRDELGRRRLFDMRSPAAGPQFFGRERELETVERDVLNGHSLGVFGLRKVGKTSLLGHLGEKLRQGAPSQLRVIPVQVDLQEIHYQRPSFDGVAELIGRKLDAAVEHAQIRLPVDYADPLDRLVETVEHVERTLGARVLLILDEYEVLLAGRRIPPSDGVDLLTWLRGVVQGHSRGFSIVLAGRNPKLLAPARIQGVDNPMYRFLRTVHLAGLTSEDCRTMVRKLGGRMGLKFGPEALDVVVHETGGHPALVRTLGNLVDERIPTSERSPALVDAAVVRHVLPRFSRVVDEDMRELVDASNDIHADAGDYLVHLVYDVPWIGGPSEARINDALIEYGILHSESRELRIGRLQAWLRENYACPPKAAHG